MSFHTIEEAIDDIRQGKMIILVDDEDRELIEAAFELLMPTWQAAEALDAGQRLTELGRWGLPRALAWAWGGEFDADRGPNVDSSQA